MATVGEIVRWIVNRLRKAYYRVVRRVMRRDRLLWGSERKFRGLLESAPDAMVIVNAHGHISLVNAQAERLFGYRREEIIGQSIGELIPERHRARRRHEMMRYLLSMSTRSTAFGIEIRGRHKDGSEFPIEVGLGPLETDEGLLVSIAIRDITDRKRVLTELAAAEALFRGAFDGSPIGMALTDEAGRVVEVNDALCTLTGYTAEKLVGGSFDLLLDPHELADRREAIGRMLSGATREYKAETRCIHACGDPIWVALQATMLRDQSGERMSCLMQAQDITYRRRYEENLQYLATHDPLTGLHNRASFESQLEAHADLVRRYGTDGAVLLLDLDHFKYVNDTLGHHAGNELIKRVAQVLEGRLRASDILARLGGDEFAVLLPRADAATAQRVANNLLEALRAERISVPRMRDQTITASIGAAVFEAGNGASGENILISADAAMYDAKDAGRNQVALYFHGEHASTRIRGRVTWAQRIRVAIEEDRLTLMAQPIIDLPSGKATQFEVLLRMIDDNGGLILPGAFLPTAERLGMIQQIDALTVTNAIRALAAHDTDGGPAGPCVELNLSGASLGDSEILDVIERELRETGLDPRRVIFEITETAAITNMAKAREFSEQLARLGCRFALDDFGAGFGSFYYLKHVRFDVLKIDGEFVRDCCASATDRLVIQAVVDIARGLGKQTVAEHVSDAQTVCLLGEMGVNYGQGFYLAKPEPLNEFLNKLSSTARAASGPPGPVTLLSRPRPPARPGRRRRAWPSRRRRAASSHRRAPVPRRCPAAVAA